MQNDNEKKFHRADAIEALCNQLAGCDNPMSASSPANGVGFKPVDACIEPWMVIPWKRKELETRVQEESNRIREGYATDCLQNYYINQLKLIDKYPVLEYVGDRINAPIMYNSLLERWASMFSENIIKTVVDYVVDFFEAEHSSCEVTYIIGGMLLFEKLNDIHALDLSTFQVEKNDE